MQDGSGLEDLFKIKVYDGEELNVGNLWTVEERKNILESPDGEFKSSAVCLNVFARAFKHGFVWPNWSPSLHRSFPKNVRDAIFTVLLCHKKKDCIISLIPKVCLFI